MALGPSESRGVIVTSTVIVAPLLQQVPKIQMTTGPVQSTLVRSIPSTVQVVSIPGAELMAQIANNPAQVTTLAREGETVALPEAPVTPRAMVVRENEREAVAVCI